MTCICEISDSELFCFRSSQIFTQVLTMPVQCYVHQCAICFDSVCTPNTSADTLFLCGQVTFLHNERTVKECLGTLHGILSCWHVSGIVDTHTICCHTISYIVAHNVSIKGFRQCLEDIWQRSNRQNKSLMCRFKVSYSQLKGLLGTEPTHQQLCLCRWLVTQS